MLLGISKRLFKTTLFSTTSKHNKGFTMIELIMTMAVIGGLAGIILINYPGATKAARDTQRKSDLEQYALALEKYANKNNGFYPSVSGVQDPSASGFCTTTLGFSSANECADDPKKADNDCSSQSCQYGFRSNGSGGATATEYVLYAPLEKPIDTTNIYYVNCSDGRAGHVSTEPSGSSCPGTLY